MDSENLLESAEIYMAENLLRTEGFQPDDSLPAIFSTMSTDNGNNLKDPNEKVEVDSNYNHSLQQFLDLQLGGGIAKEPVDNGQQENYDLTNAFRVLTNKVINSHQADEIILESEQGTIVVNEGKRRFVYKILTEDDLNDEEDSYEGTDDQNNINNQNIQNETSSQMEVTTIKTEVNGIKNDHPSQQKPKGRRGRPPKGQNKSSINSVEAEKKKSDLAKKETNFNIQKQRTRSGRLVKICSVIEEEKSQTFQEILEDIKDKDFELNMPAKKDKHQTDVANLEYKSEDSMNVKRKFPPDSVCPTCKKIFLGKRMQKHFLKFPDHMKKQESIKNEKETISLFQFLINKLETNASLSEDQRADLFLNEIDDFVNQLQLRSSRLIRNTSGLHFVSGRSSRVLGIPEGQYALDLNALDQVPEPEPELEPEMEPIPENIFNISNYHPVKGMHMAVPSVNSRSFDMTAISMDETLTDEAVQKLNLSVGGKLLPPSEESLLRAVDDLGIKKLDSVMESSTNNVSVIPHYDHVNDNAMEAGPMKETKILSPSPILDLNVDFFKFGNNNL